MVRTHASQGLKIPWQRITITYPHNHIVKRFNPTRILIEIHHESISGCERWEQYGRSVWKLRHRERDFRIKTLAATHATCIHYKRAVRFDIVPHITTLTSVFQRMYPSLPTNNKNLDSQRPECDIRIRNNSIRICILASTT